MVLQLYLYINITLMNTSFFTMTISSKQKTNICLYFIINELLKLVFKHTILHLKYIFITI